jgi:HEAT repeat protein
MLSDEEISAKIKSGSTDEGVQWAVQLVRGNSAYLSILLRLLREADDQRVRRKIAMALGELGSYYKDVAEGLISRILDDDNEDVVKSASEAIAKIGERRALPSLVRAIRRFPDSYYCL